FVCAYERDWLECKREGEKYGLDILFGIEEGVEGYSEILLYGLTPEMLYSHPELKECGAEGWYSIMHELGILVIQAHPFRVLRPVPNPVALPLQFIDGIEVYNGGNPPEDNEKAEAFAAEHPELILTSGADTHDANSVGINGIMTDRRIKTVEDLVAVLRSGEYELIENQNIVKN
ncbi:MAG: PHP domain-containing protein, partial [Clostridia bacterium]|nr:PHP domain-containing protein [Clostridia bacterium]